MAPQANLVVEALGKSVISHLLERRTMACTVLVTDATTSPLLVRQVSYQRIVWFG